ncbi:TonB-dependent receptor domain-containing protein [Phenylobacterium sp. J367]|uniref:TonB-dependent receptor domain-containing protein n=1 Tax=Phenylobacterium sp. J367 TaxID=2898435 RepID=UPI0027E3A85E|nr:TonB-dependent receptor [Phenylobacterium sp. J367]
MTFAAPGNILRQDPVTRVTGPYWGIPPGQPGVGLQPSDFLAGQLNYDDPRAGQDILPAQRRISLVANARQELGKVELQADARYSFRRSKAEIRAQTATLTVSRNNPFFVSPNGSTSHQIAYAFGDDIGGPFTRPTSESLSLALGAAAPLAGDWRLDAYAGFAQEIQETGSAGQLNSALLQEALGNVADRPDTGYSPQRDGYFNPFSGLPNQRSAVLAAIGSGFSDTRTVTRVATGNAQADGTVLDLPGGALKVALGGQLRREALDRHGSSYTSTTAPVAIAAADVGRTVAAAFAEARAPLFGAENARPGFRSLEFSGAVRVERYSDFGTTANPKAGLSWGPAEGLNLRATYGHSFRAPALTELNDTQLYTAAQFPLGSGRILGLLLQGGNADLEPETAKTWTLGADVQPSAIAGLRISATLFETAFEDRIDQPARQNLAGVLADPTLAPFVRRIQPDTSPADLQLITALLADPAAASAGLFPPQDYRAIVDARLVNTGRLTVRGLDLQASYAPPLAGGDLNLSANASWLFDYVQQLTPTSAAVDRSGQAGYPADLRARLAADWTRGPVSAGLALNHMGDLRTPDGRGIDSLSTVDLRVSLKGGDGSRLRGVALDLTVRNLFDTDPPFYDNPDGFAFDPANADVVGRFVSLELSRSW